jgi:hypothetical protein
MKKLKIILILLTIAITIAPIAIEVLLYQDNLLDLIIPPQIASIVNGNSNNSNEKNVNGNNLLNPEFKLPQPVGEPQYNPQTKTISFTLNFTNPLNTPLELDRLQAGLVSHDDGFFLGNITINQPLKIDPGQTVDITALGTLSNGAIDYLKSKSAIQNAINLDFVNLNVDLSGIRLQLDKQNIGNAPIPPQILA